MMMTISDCIARCKMIPSLACILLPVAAVRVAFVTVAPDAAHLWPSFMVGDTRSWWKAALVIGIALWMLVMTVARAATGWKPSYSVWTGLILAAAAGVVLSATGSQYANTAWLGYTTLYEGAFVLVAYLVAAWYVSEAVGNDAEGFLLLRSAGAVCLFEAAHGIAEGFGRQIWRTDFGRWLMGTGRSEVTYRFSGSRMAYGTVFQPNHYGMLMAMLGALALGMIFCERKRGWRIFWLVGYVGALAAALCSNSRTGILVLLGVSVLCAGCIAIDKMRRGKTSASNANGKQTRPLIILCMLVVAGLALFWLIVPEGVAGRFWMRMKAVSAPVAIAPDEARISLANNRVTIDIPGKEFFVTRTPSRVWNISVRENNGVENMVIANATGEDRGGGWKGVPIPELQNGEILFRDEGNVRLKVQGYTVPFYAAGSRIWWVDEAGKRLVPDVPASEYTVSGNEGIFSLRGYIWRRTLEVCRDLPLFGTGPGTFAQAFPNADLLNRQRFGSNIIEDKGHGIWATFSVQLGLAGFTLYVLPFLYGLYRLTARLVRVGVDRCFPVFLGLAAYCLCALTNDSTVGVTPIFCVLAGVGVAFSSNAKTPDTKNTDPAFITRR